MKKQKKYLWVILSIILTTCILIVINDKQYGTEEIIIANYMPPGIENKPSWITVKLKRTICDMNMAFFIGILISSVESLILYIKQIISEDKFGLILLLLIYIVPLLIAGIKLSNIYGYVC